VFTTRSVSIVSSCSMPSRTVSGSRRASSASASLGVARDRSQSASIESRPHGLKQRDVCVERFGNLGIFNGHCAPEYPVSGSLLLWRPWSADESSSLRRRVETFTEPRIFVSRSSTS
jgi:hypothetical protein